jgi:hypothetical protein
MQATDTGVWLLAEGHGRDPTLDRARNERTRCEAFAATTVTPGLRTRLVTESHPTSPSR